MPKTTKAFYLGQDGQCCMVDLPKKKKDQLAAIRAFIFQGMNCTDRWIQSYTFGEVSECHPGGNDVIYMDENGKNHGSEENPFLPWFVGNLLVCGLDDDGKVTNLHCQREQIQDLFVESLNRKEESRRALMDLVTFYGIVNKYIEVDPETRRLMVEELAQAAQHRRKMANEEVYISPCDTCNCKK